jgi:ABC-type transport system involved in cytochrome c biogenesis permease subunit
MTLYPVGCYNGYELKKREGVTMKTENLVQEAGAVREAKPDRRAQLAQYLAQQPQFRRTFDRWMKILEIAGLAFVAGWLAWAVYVSINWSQPNQIAAVWFVLPVSIVALMILVGLHAVGIRAFFPIVVPSSSLPFVTGSKAVSMGAGFAALSLFIGAFWAAFAWGMWTTNWAILEPLGHILGVVIGVGVVFAVASDLYRKFFRPR